MAAHTSNPSPPSSSLRATRPARIPTNREALGYFWRLLLMIREYWSRLALGLVVGALMTGFALVPPYLTKLLVDRVYVTSDVPLLHLILWTTLTLAVASAVIGAVRNYFTMVVGSELTTSTSLMFFAHIMAQPVRFFDERRTGEILARASDARASLGTVTRIFGTVLTNGLQVLVVPPLLFWLNWRLAALSLIGLPITTAISLGASRLVRRYAKQAAEAGAEMSATQIDALAHVRTIKLLCAEGEMFARVRELTLTTLGFQLRSAAVTGGVNVLRASVSAGATALFTWFGWMAIINREMTLGGFLAFSAYLRYLTGPVTSLSSLLTDFQVSAVSLGRLFEYLDFAPEYAPETLYTTCQQSSPAIGGSIACRDVHFSYPSGREALAGVSFDLPAGASLAIVGESGAGKSTLVRLLCGLDVPSAGVVRLGGVTMSGLSTAQIRSTVSAVWQETGIVRGTLRQNLLLGVSDVSEHDIERVIASCRLDDLVSTIPGGLEAPLGEAGSLVSGGQRQRIVLARALLRRTPVLVLDEATSSMDAETERAVLDAVLSERGLQTVIYVTHRVHTAASADFVLLMTDGAVDGFDRHDALLASNLRYRALWKSAGRDSEASESRAMAGNA